MQVLNAKKGLDENQKGALNNLLEGGAFGEYKAKPSSGALHRACVDIATKQWDR